ncbi:MAG: bifunctional folylpolyglutamate synthase/dihydrofolate synthase [Flavobacteriales bacterium]|nr:bifunctional folylpolyglutamate synthase/dihydrofolate synthase [Flavobacteriales bacterium]
MTYAQTLDYLFSHLPSFQRIGAAAYKADMGNIMVLCEHLGHPDKKFRSIHIAGTNGKGSVSHMLASVFQEAGYKTGLYTSPHLKDFRERIRVNGAYIPEDAVVSFTENIRETMEELQPSFFEITVAMAFSYFADEQVDIAIVETGMGGRLDSTNILYPDVSVITNIGWDHTAFLGNTLEAIAGEKAGIIKAGVPVVVGQTQEEIRHVFEKVAAERDAPLSFADASVQGPAEASPPWTYVNQHNETYHITPGLGGGYQRDNVRTVLATIPLLREKDWQLSQDQVEAGIRNVMHHAPLLGRWQVLQKENPTVIADAMHNVDGIRASLKELEHLPHKHLHFVFGTVKDKAVADVLPVLPPHATYYLCQAQIPRAMDAQELLKAFTEAGLHASAYPTVKDALQVARKNAGPGDVVLVGGSIFVVAEVL